ncbi:hypothetical protein D3C78_1656790 [compost metagenome]
MAQLEAWRVVHDAGLAGDGLDDFLAAVAGVDAPQAGGAVQDLPAIGRGVVHAFGRCQHARVSLELLVGSEGHPEMGQVGQIGGGVHGGSRENETAVQQGERRCRRDSVDSGPSQEE